ncbi:type II secretion system protein E [Saccharolobus solfataricus]|uniref:Type II secretion system protein E n=2 Tax=Saccharolobus solfataricus TaxID=2287 RepID=A0A0E3JZD4_SACSO|nr:type II/IV secretion system ATPase subunit [Saccharolobus solfataricus]AKA74984.1 type II secretion system protein E [Saccharolobus solfataricus]AKA77679.1 type II secretion system protein E [Saccharolobus solfataricus]AKA80369.1 type II secretion system protein E [Saccharolobus solfataricus]AZF69449.1 type II secretion system protein E [Saccharolobus solfataricus]AZF72069.1 type II secretion system protein E [Saccharolobus solfataricus]
MSKIFKFPLQIGRGSVKQLPITDLPITLYPVTPLPEEVTTIVADYEVNILNLVPEDIKSNLTRNNIELILPNPHVFITFDERKGIYKYVLLEPPVNEMIYNIYNIFIEEVERELLSKNPSLDLAKIIFELDKKRSGLKIIQEKRGDIYVLSTNARVTLYYLLRNMFGYNVLTPLVADKNIEDISVPGLNNPVYVYHRSYEYIPTNIIFTKNMQVSPQLNIMIDGEELLDQLVLRMLSTTGKSISVAEPIQDGMLPNGDRVAATFRREVSASGSSVVIRRFSERPITILGLINSGTLSPELAAYLWYGMDLRMSVMSIGVTGAGKTTLLNAVLNLVKESMKIVSIEDIPEIRLAHTNWVQLYARPAYAGVGKEISLMDLLKLSLRYRPDIIVVGEIRGQEAYVLFQATSTGHGGATTFHAYNTDSAIKRLMNEPLNIPQEWIPMMNIIMTIRRLPVYIGEKIVLRRRVVAVDEIVSWNDYRRVSSWDPKSDAFTINLDAARVLKNRIEEAGLNLDDVKREMERRALFLKLLASSREIIQNEESYKLVKSYIIKYSLKPEEALKEAQAMARTKTIELKE